MVFATWLFSAQMPYSRPLKHRKIETNNYNTMKTQALKTTVASLLLSIILFSSYACSGEKKANAQAANQPFELTIHAAAMSGNIEAVKEHIAAKTDLNEKDSYGSTPLSVSATFNKPEITKLLIEAGADINAKIGDGSTVLHVAAFFGRTDIVKMVLAAGVDTKVRNNFGATALESIQTSFDSVKMIYDQLGKDLAPLGLELDYDEIKASRPVISKMIIDHQSAH